MQYLQTEPNLTERKNDEVMRYYKSPQAGSANAFQDKLNTQPYLSTYAKFSTLLPVAYLSPIILAIGIFSVYARANIFL